MYVALYLLTLAGLVGSYDVLYYHIYKLRLYRQRDAVWENITHAIRALLFGCMMITVLNLECTGGWWLLYPVLLSCELTNTMTDTIFEPSSRRNMGGLPPVEYSLHVFLSIVTGAALASILWGTYPLLWEPSAVHWRLLDVPWYVLPGSYFSVVVAGGMFVFESTGVFRLLAARRKAAQVLASECSATPSR
jgi:hypothetical protein